MSVEGLAYIYFKSNCFKSIIITNLSDSPKKGIGPSADSRFFISLLLTEPNTKVIFWYNKFGALFKLQFSALYLALEPSVAFNFTQMVKIVNIFQIDNFTLSVFIERVGPNCSDSFKIICFKMLTQAQFGPKHAKIKLWPICLWASKKPWCYRSDI